MQRETLTLQYDVLISCAMSKRAWLAHNTGNENQQPNVLWKQSKTGFAEALFSYYQH